MDNSIFGQLIRDIKPLDYRDLHGKTLDMHYGEVDGYYIVAGCDRETGVVYVIKSGKKEDE